MGATLNQHGNGTATGAVILPPRRATFGRWWRLSGTRYSVLRGLESEALDGLVLRGRTLDVGGGRHNSYYHLLQFDGAVDSINLDAAIEPTILADLNGPWPIRDAAYDHVICLNTLEHVFRDEHALREMFRILTPGGTFHVMVPLLYRVHASPSDFHRHTAYWWRDFLLALPTPPAELTVEPLLWGPKSSAFSLLEFHRYRSVRKKLTMLRDVASHLRFGGQRLPERQAKGAANLALGYYIHGVR